MKRELRVQGGHVGERKEVLLRGVLAQVRRRNMHDKGVASRERAYARRTKISCK